MAAGALGPFGGQNASSYQKKSDLLANYAKKKGSFELIFKRNIS
jgi:hypothetical protein